MGARPVCRSGEAISRYVRMTATGAIVPPSGAARLRWQVRKVGGGTRRDVALTRAEPGGLRAIATRGHVAPAPATVSRRIVEHARATAISAPPDAKQLSSNEGFGRRLHDRNHEAGKRVANGNEALPERSVVAELHAPMPRAATEDAIDLREGVGTRFFLHRATLSQCPQGGAHPARVDQRGRCTGGLLFGATRYAHGPLDVEHTSRAQPLNERVEIAKHVDAHSAPQVVSIDEIQPQSLADEYEGRWRHDHLGHYTRGGLRGEEGHWRQAYVQCRATASELFLERQLRRGSRTTAAIFRCDERAPRDVLSEGPWFEGRGPG